MRHKVDPQYNYALSQVFNAGLLQRITNPAFEDDLRSLLLSSGVFSKRKSWDFSEALKATYDYLKKHYRCEYVYKNEIANQLLLKHHNDNSATLLREFGLVQSIADIVIINGRTVAYEIKTELDNFDRLQGQLTDYTTIFDNVFVVTHAGALNSVKKRTESHIGIIILDSNGELITERSADSCEDMFSLDIAARTLRQSELVSAYKKYEGCLPDVGSAYIGRYCQDWFVNLDKSSAHFIFSESLKSRRPTATQFELVIKSPEELRILLIGKHVSKKHCEVLSNRFGIFV